MLMDFASGRGVGQGQGRRRCYTYSNAPLFKRREGTLRGNELGPYLPQGIQNRVLYYVVDLRGKPMFKTLIIELLVRIKVYKQDTF